MAAPPIRLSFSGGTLVLEGTTAGADVPRTFPGPQWVWDRRVSAWRCDALHYEAIRGTLWEISESQPLTLAISHEQRRSRMAEATLQRKSSTIVDSVPEWKAVHWPKLNIHPLRPEQKDALAAWMKQRRGVIVMPTGTGKTEVALSIMHDTVVSTLVVAPVRDLMYQWHRRILQGLGYDAGIIGDNVFMVRPVSVTTYDSAYIHMDKLGAKFGLIIFDECHHLPGEARRDAARMSAAPMRLGLSATPERSDGRHVDLEWLIGPRVYEMPISAARGRALAEYDVVRIPVHLSDAEQARYDALSWQVRRYMIERRQEEPEYSWEDLCAETGQDPAARRALRAYRQKRAIEDRAEEKLRVLEDLFRLHAGSPVLVFAGSNAMARDVSRRFLIPCLLNHCGKKERLDILTGLQDGSYPALVANQVLDEGVDLPDVKVAVVVGGMASTKQAKQRLGRILRKSGNARATLYEVVCSDTREEVRSRQRRDSDAYVGTRHRRI